jgi:phosphate butyryltransferase
MREIERSTRRESTMSIRTFRQLLAEAQRVGARRVAIVAAEQRETLEAADQAYQAGLADFTLVGDGERLRQLLAETGFDLGDWTLAQADSPRRAAQRAIELALVGQVDMLMNGSCPPPYLLQLATDAGRGLRGGRLMSDVTVAEVPGVDRLIFVSDVAVIATPTLEQKIGIVQNAIDVARALGVETPKVAILSATEMVNPKIPVSMDAANLAKMAQRGQIKGGIVDGPLALDNAISPEAARVKGIRSEVAGRADILIAPDVEAGNILSKALSYFAGGKLAGVVVGGRCPLVLPSRSDPPEAKLASLALGIFLTTKMWAENGATV